MIEFLFGFAPDNGDGSLELKLVAVLLSICFLRFLRIARGNRKEARS
jgi:hypothetical protein